MASKPTFQRKLLHPKYALTWLAIAVWWLLVKLPYPVMRVMAKGLGRLLYAIGGSRRHIVERNIALCYPEMRKGEQQALIKKNFFNYGMAFFEMPMSWWWRDKRLLAKTVISGSEHIENLNGQGALLMSMHFVHVELCGQAVIANGMPMDAMYRVHNNPVFEYVQSRGRMCRSPNSDIFVRRDVRGVAKALRKGRLVWYAPDQDYGVLQGVFVPFFGVNAATITATSKLARMGKAKVIPFVHCRKDDGSGYQIDILPPLENFPSNDEVADAARINQVLEAAIRRYPEQYLWAHRRFKTRPKGEASLYK